MKKRMLTLFLIGVALMTTSVSSAFDAGGGKDAKTMFMGDKSVSDITMITSIDEVNATVFTVNGGTYVLNDIAIVNDNPAFSEKSGYSETVKTKDVNTNEKSYRWKEALPVPLYSNKNSLVISSNFTGTLSKHNYTYHNYGNRYGSASAKNGDKIYLNQIKQCISC